jgi:putative pyruvate formate lyase activating enzyme
MRICRIAPHFYEEPPISGTKGSGTVFFSGCGMDCEFCQNHEISKHAVGKIYSPEALSEELKKLEDSGVHNINFVTPTHFSHKIRETLDIYRPKIPIVYNTSGYELPEITREMLPYVDIFLVDMKYGDNKTAAKYSKTSDYVENCTASMKIMIENKPLFYDGNLLKQGVIVRNLVLPENLENSFEVINYFAEHYKDSAILSVMSQFVPMYKSTIKRTLKPLEYKLIINKIIEKGIDNCFIQELSSASGTYVPAFDTRS